MREPQQSTTVSEIDLARLFYSKADLPALADQIERAIQTRFTIKREVSNPAWVELVRAFATYQCLYEAVLTGEAIVAMEPETCRLVVFPHQTRGGSG
jgi:hypothetical protein